MPTRQQATMHRSFWPVPWLCEVLDISRPRSIPERYAPSCGSLLIPKVALPAAALGRFRLSKFNGDMSASRLKSPNSGQSAPGLHRCPNADLRDLGRGLISAQPQPDWGELGHREEVWPAAAFWNRHSATLRQNPAAPKRDVRCHAFCWLGSRSAPAKRRRPHRDVHPPSNISALPVISDAASEARNTAAAATSSTRPTRPSGIFDSTSVRNAGSRK